MTTSERCRIHHVTGDILSASVEAIVIPVNTVGALGAGLALKARLRYPEIEVPYRSACTLGELKPGTCIAIPLANRQHKYAIMFPTKLEWKHQSRMTYIDTGLTSLAALLAQYEITSVAIPALGCGLGGLIWANVKQAIVAAMTPVVASGVQVFVYAPVFNNGRSADRGPGVTD